MKYKFFSLASERDGKPNGKKKQTVNSEVDPVFADHFFCL